MSKNPRLIDITGKRFGHWTVLSQSGNAKGGGAIWLAVCDCGTKKSVLGADIRKGKSTSCGCLSVDRLGNFARTHGRSQTRLHRIWKNMRRRCSSENLPGWRNYGGRGIRICDEWSDFETFAVWAIGHGYNPDLSIDRIDVNGNYCPANCRWATAQMQAENRRTTQRAPDGELWWHKAKRNGVTAGAYRSRLSDHWPIEEAATVSLGTRRLPRKRNEKGQFI